MDVELAADQPTAIELLSEILAVLRDLKCNVVEAEVWTHNRREGCGGMLSFMPLYTLRAHKLLRYNSYSNLKGLGFLFTYVFPSLIQKQRGRGSV